MNTNQPTEFPKIPKDNRSIELLQNLVDLANTILNDDIDSPRLKKIAGYLMIIGEVPHIHENIYYRMYTELQPNIGTVLDYYSHYIVSMGDEYKTDTLNDEIGDMYPYFNEFQIIANDINEQAKIDPRWNPLNTLLWGLYCSFYSYKKNILYLDTALKIFEDCK